MENEFARYNLATIVENISMPKYRAKRCVTGAIATDMNKEVLENQSEKEKGKKNSSTQNRTASRNR
jgi:hypothetical protein